MNKTNIEWTDFSWNPVTGCTKISAGCKNCYAEAMMKRIDKCRSFGNVQLHWDRVSQPVDRKKAAKIFVCSMADLFHDNVMFEFIDTVYYAMTKRPQHTFQILTKRPKRAIEYYNHLFGIARFGGFPFKNVWFGVSAETQWRADERIPLLLEIPAAVRFVSVEPQLNYIDLTRYLDRLDWVIVGGETGRYARPFDLNWARAIKEQCKEAGVPFFFKQTGGQPNLKDLDGVIYHSFPKVKE
jgi:protein gp37